MSLGGIIISNSTALIFLARIGKLDILREIFGRIVIPREVYNEVVIKGSGRPGSAEVKLAIGDWIEVRDVKNKELMKVLSLGLDEGESACISLALELNASYVILDDLLARRVARSLGLKVIGTIGVLLLAKKLGIISNIKEAIYSLRRAGFWVSEELLKEVLKLAGEG